MYYHAGDKKLSRLGHKAEATAEIVASQFECLSYSRR
jgi:hypothetical protein